MRHILFPSSGGGVQRGFDPLWLTSNFSAAVAIAKNCVVSTVISRPLPFIYKRTTGKKKTEIN